MSGITLSIVCLGCMPVITSSGHRAFPLLSFPIRPSGVSLRIVGRRPTMLGQSWSGSLNYARHVCYGGNISQLRSSTVPFVQGANDMVGRCEIRWSVANFRSVSLMKTTTLATRPCFGGRKRLVPSEKYRRGMIHISPRGRFQPFITA